MVPIPASTSNCPYTLFLSVNAGWGVGAGVGGAPGGPGLDAVQGLSTSSWLTNGTTAANPLLLVRRYSPLAIKEILSLGWNRLSTGSTLRFVTWGNVSQHQRAPCTAQLFPKIRTTSCSGRRMGDQSLSARSSSSSPHFLKSALSSAMRPRFSRQPA